MSRPRGGIIAGTLPAWTTTATSGVFTLREAHVMRTGAQWPRSPVAPTGLTATAGNTELSLSWTAPATTYGTITNYLVEYTPSGGSAAYVLTGSTSTSYTLTGLTNGTEYTVRVAAVNFTAGDYSDTATGTPVSVISLQPIVNGFEVTFIAQATEVPIVANGGWRVNGSTSWGHSYTNRFPVSVVAATAEGALIRRDGSNFSYSVGIRHKLVSGVLRPTYYTNGYQWLPSNAGSYTSTWTVDGFVGGVLKYSGSFSINFTYNPD